jgi:hypothetical protein
MSKFIKPSSGTMSILGNDVEFNDSNLTNLSKIVSPYDGVTTKVTLTDPNCVGRVVINHDLGSKTVTSEFCGVSNISTYTGKRLSKGGKIGYFGSSPIKYSILDSRGNKLNPTDYFEKSYGDNKAPKNKTRDNNIGYEKSTVKKTSILGDLAMSALESPLKYFGKEISQNFWPSRFKKESIDGSDDMLSEEIQRIKSLMK